MAAYVPDKLEDVALLRVLGRGTAEVVEDAAGGLLLRDGASSVWMLAAPDTELGASWLRAHAGDGIGLLMLVGDELVDRARECLGLAGHMDCVQAVYQSREVPRLETGLAVRPAVPADLPWVALNYDLADEGELLEVIERGLLFVGRLAGVDVGFVGEHQEGSMGLLHVLPEFRGRGLGADLERWMIGHTLARGQLPYCHVEVGNGPSLSLQRKLGLSFAARHVHWLG